jgi:hypothetical protein
VRGAQRVSVIELFGQGEYWMDADGRVHSIKGMDLGYCENVYAYLLRNSKLLAEQAYCQIVRTAPPQGEMAQDSFDSMLNELMEAIDGSDRWIKRQSLMEALEQRILSFGAHQGTTREVTVVLKLNVPVNRGADVARRSFERTLAGLPYEHEVIAFTE